LISTVSRLLFCLTTEGKRRVAVVATLALLYSLVPILVEALSTKQIILTALWGQTATAAGTDGVVPEEHKTVPPAVKDKDSATAPQDTPMAAEENAPAAGDEGVAAEDQGSAGPKEAEQKKEDEQEKEEGQGQEEEQEAYVDRTQRWVSAGIEGSARIADEFFGDENYEAEAKNTRLRVMFDTFFESGEAVDFSVRFNLRLVLPILNKRLKLSFSGNSDDDNDDNETGVITGANDDENNADASLAYTAVDTRKQNLSLRTGVKSGPAWWIGPRYRFYTRLGGPWGFRFTQLIRWRTDDGWEAKTRLDFERRIAENFLFRFTPRGTYNQDDYHEDGYKYRLEAKVFQRLDRNSALRYEWLNHFLTKPDNHLDEIVLKIGYRRRVWRKWLFFEVVPQASFPDDEDFHFTPGILFRIETNFGKRYIGKIE
jgi:hypothetical protein